MNTADKYGVVVPGSGTGGRLMARSMAQEGMRTAVVERRYIDGSCVNIACLPSKNVVHTAKVASFVRRHQGFGKQTGPTAVNIEAGGAQILIDPFLSDDPSRDNGWSGCLTSNNSTQGGDR